MFTHFILYMVIFIVILLKKKEGDQVVLKIQEVTLHFSFYEILNHRLPTAKDCL